MSRIDDRTNALAVLPQTASYDVGYARPPAANRFKKGTSGNPRGRPKGSKNRTNAPALHEERLKSIILEEAYRTITLNDVNGRITVPMVQAIVRSLAVNAAKGNQRAQRLFTNILSVTERERRRSFEEWQATAINYKVEWERELQRRARLGIEAPDPIPHPDHIIITSSGQIEVRGPMTKDEKQQLDLWRQQVEVFEAELTELQSMAGDPDHPDQQEILKEIARTKKAIEILAIVLKAGRVPSTFPELEDHAGLPRDFGGAAE